MNKNFPHITKGQMRSQGGGIEGQIPLNGKIFSFYSTIRFLHQ